MIPVSLPTISFISYTSPIIVYPCHFHWLTHCCLVDLTDVTLTFEDANSKILDVDIEESVDNSSVEVLKLRFGREVEPEFWSQYWNWSLIMILKYTCCSKLWGWDLSRLRGWKLVKILKQKFGQHFEADFWSTFLRLRFDWNSQAELLSRFWSWSSVEILRLEFGKDSKAEFCYCLRAVTFVVRCVFGNAFTFFRPSPRDESLGLVAYWKLAVVLRHHYYSTAGCRPGHR